MFKVFVTINCDECGSDFPQGRVSPSEDPMEWKVEAYELIGEAEQGGWDFFGSRMRCAGCNCPEPGHVVVRGPDCNCPLEF